MSAPARPDAPAAPGTPDTPPQAASDKAPPPLAKSDAVAIIGAGWAGLAAAVELTAQRLPVVVYEAGRELGGRARRVSLKPDGQEGADIVVDNGQHLLLGAYEATLALMRQVGLTPEDCLQRLPLKVTDGGNKTAFTLALPKLPPPFNLAWGMLTARGVPLGEKLACARFMQALKKRRFRLENPGTVSQWLDAAGQRGALRRHLWEPLCLAALNTPAERACAQRFANVLRDSLGNPAGGATDLLLPKVDLGQLLPDAAARWLENRGSKLLRSHRIRHVAAGPDSIQVDDCEHPAAIIAVAPHHLPALWPGVPVDLRSEPIATLYYQCPGDFHLPFPLLSSPGPLGQWVVDRGDGLIAAVLSGHGEWEALDDDALAAALREELGLPGPPRWQQVIREKRATFSCQPDHRATPSDTGHPRLRLAGDHTWAEYPATLEGAVRSGRLAARELCTALSGLNATRPPAG